MKCENCGKEIYSVEVNMFKRDGSDDWFDAEISGDDDKAACIIVTPNWTGMGLDEEEQTETIRCPRCRKFPFKYKTVDAHECVEVVMFKTSERKEE